MTKLVLTALVSGAQTGADRGGLDAAIVLDLAYGGWMPLGRKAEDGTIPEIYANRMRESPSPSYPLRTRLNVQDSDATLIVSFSSFRSGGTQLTADTAQRMRKPCKHLVLPARGATRIPDAVAEQIRAWLVENRVVILNVAGPRESKEPGLQAAVRDALVWILEDETLSRDGEPQAPAPVGFVSTAFGVMHAGNHAALVKLGEGTSMGALLIEDAKPIDPRTIFEADGSFTVSREQFYRGLTHIAEVAIVPPCPKCYGRGWYPETFEVDGYEDQRERYCDCPAGAARRASE